MAFTRHGHQIPKTPELDISMSKVNCGGVEDCKTCKSDALAAYAAGEDKPKKEHR